VSEILTADSFPLWRYRGTFVRAKDGDTIVVQADHGKGIYSTWDLRLEGFNAPELHGPNPERARAAKAQLERLLTGRTLYFVTRKDRQSFERYVATVYVADDAGVLTSVAELMRPWAVPQGE
jgi:endonuclease YncB( thermonuclease family)